MPKLKYFNTLTIKRVYWCSAAGETSLGVCIAAILKDEILVIVGKAIDLRYALVDLAIVKESV